MVGLSRIRIDIGERDADRFNVSAVPGSASDRPAAAPYMFELDGIDISAPAFADHGAIAVITSIAQGVLFEP